MSDEDRTHLAVEAITAVYSDGHEAHLVRIVAMPLRRWRRPRVLGAWTPDEARLVAATLNAAADAADRASAAA